MQDVFLRRNSSNEMVALTEKAIGSALQLEARGYRLEEQLGALEVGTRVVDVVRVAEEKGGDAEARLDLDDREEGNVGLTNGF